jgi:hypothetical protein
MSLGIASAKIRHNFPTIYSTPKAPTDPAEELKTRFSFSIGIWKTGKVALAVAEDQGCEIRLGQDATFTSQENGKGDENGRNSDGSPQLTQLAP